MAKIKINYTIAIEGNVYLLCPIKYDNGEYYEVYKHSNNDMYGDYIGDFKSVCCAIRVSPFLQD